MKKLYFIFSFIFLFLIIPFIFKVYAARLTPVQDIMSNNTVSSVSNNNFIFSANGGLPANATVTIVFPTGFSNINTSTATSNLTGSSFAVSSNTITLTTTTAAESPGYQVNINNIYATNPSTVSSSTVQYIINISDSAGDSAGVGVVITSYSSYGSGPAGDQYEQAITINNTANTSTLTNYQVEVTVNTASLISAGQMQSDCADIRFTDSSGNLLPYWIESGCNTTTTQIWVNVDTVTASADTTINLYYGSSSASPQSNGRTTFPFFDNFLSPSLNTSIWSSSGGASCYSYTPGAITINCGALYTNNTIGSQPNLIEEAQVSWSSFTSNSAGGAYSGLNIANSQETQPSNSGANKLVYFMSSNSSPGEINSYISTGTASGYNENAHEFAATVNTPYIISDTVTPNNVKFYLNNSMINEFTYTWSSPFYLYLGYYQGSGSGTTAIDPLTVNWVFTREYTATPPTVSVSSSVTDLLNNQVELTLNVSPYIIFGISSNSVNLGLLSFSYITSQSNSLSLSTNAQDGANISVEDEYSGLYSSLDSYTIPSSTQTLSTGTQGYGINASSSAMSISSPYNSTGYSIGGLTSSNNVALASSNNVVQNANISLNYLSSISTTTPTGVYIDNITYIASGNF